MNLECIFRRRAHFLLVLAILLLQECQLSVAQNGTSTNKVGNPTPQQKGFLFGDIISHLLDVFQAKPPTTTTTTTTTTPATTTTAAPKNIFESIFRGAQQMFDSMLQVKTKEPPTTTTMTTVEPTILPPGGRGISGLVYNIHNLVSCFKDLADIFQGDDRWSFKYMLKRVQDCITNAMGLKDVILEANEDGGLLEIVNNTKKVFESLDHLSKQLQSKEPGHMIYLPFIFGDLMKRAGDLKDNFIIKFPPSTPLPSGMKIKNLRFDEEPDFNNFGAGNVTGGARKGSGEFDRIMYHAGNLVSALVEIEKLLLKYNPNGKVLQMVDHFRQSVEEGIANATRSMNQQNVLDVIQKFFPHTSIAHIIGEVGKFVNKVLKNDMLKTLGNLLQQEVLVNFLLNNVKRLPMLNMGHIKDSLLQVADGVADQMLNKDRSHFILRTIISLEEKAVSFEKYMEIFHAFMEKLKFDPAKGNFISQIPSKIVEIIKDPLTGEFFIQTGLQFLRMLPTNIFKNFMDWLDSIRDKFMTGGPIRRFLFYGGPLRRFISTGGPLKLLFQGKGPLAYLLKRVLQLVNNNPALSSR